MLRATLILTTVRASEEKFVTGAIIFKIDRFLHEVSKLFKLRRRIRFLLLGGRRIGTVSPTVSIRLDHDKVISPALACVKKAMR